MAFPVNPHGLTQENHYVTAYDMYLIFHEALQYDLILVPSDSFGVKGYFRMAYCIDTEKVERSLEALRRFVKENY